MSRHYATPILLIQFDADRAFALHSASELGSDINVCTDTLLLVSTSRLVS